MPLAVGVSFRDAGKIFYYDAGSFELRAGDRVVAESLRGVELGTVKADPSELPAGPAGEPLPPVIRIATPEDIAQDEGNRAREKEALAITARKVAKHDLPMKLLRAEYTLDRARIVIYFSAEGRVDFRELVKDLASALRTRIELHQVGARDAAKLMGGFGHCGCPVCCATWLTGFESVSMRMAKDQDLALNPAKFSGQCGKLMCCLRFEVDTYREGRQGMPKVGAVLSTPAGEAKVVEVNVPAQTIRVEYLENGARATLCARECPEGLPQRHGEHGEG